MTSKEMLEVVNKAPFVDGTLIGYERAYGIEWVYPIENYRYRIAKVLETGRIVWNRYVRNKRRFGQIKRSADEFKDKTKKIKAGLKKSREMLERTEAGTVQRETIKYNIMRYEERLQELGMLDKQFGKTFVV